MLDKKLSGVSVGRSGEGVKTGRGPGRTLARALSSTGATISKTLFFFSLFSILSRFLFDSSVLTSSWVSFSYHLLLILVLPFLFLSSCLRHSLDRSHSLSFLSAQLFFLLFRSFFFSFPFPRTFSRWPRHTNAHDILHSSWSFPDCDY